MRSRLLLATSLAVLAAAACRDAAKDETAASVSLDSALKADLARAKTDTAAFSEAADVAMANPEPGERVPAEEVIPETAPVSNRVPTTRVSPGEVTMRTSRPPSAPSPSPSSPPLSAPPPASKPVPASVAVSKPAASSVTKPAVSVANEADAGNSCASPALPDQRRCLLGYLARSDVTLDRNYQAVIATLKRDAGVAPGQKEPASVERLRVAQRSWLVYRDTECRRRNRDKEGPLWAPVRARCLAEFSGERTDELAAELAKLRAR